MTLDDYNDRLLELDGRMFVLTRLVREMLPMLAHPEDINAHLATIRDHITTAIDGLPVDDDPTNKFLAAARTFVDEFMSSDVPPPRPTLTMIKGGRDAPS